MITQMIWVIVYVLNFFLNRWIFFKLQDVEDTGFVNPVGIAFCFTSLIGTIILTILWVTSAAEKGIGPNFFKAKKFRK